MNSQNTPEIFITGLGLITPVGAGPGGFWSGLCSGQGGIRPITRFDAHWLDSRIAGELRDSDPEQHLSPAEKQTAGAAEQAVWAAGRMALQDAGLQKSILDHAGLPMDFVLSTASGMLQDYTEVYKKERRQISNGNLQTPVGSQVLAEYSPGALLTKTAARLQLRGWQTLVINACASGSYALSMAAERIRLGLAQRVLAGGVELISEGFFAGFCNLRALAPDACRPFDRDRKGLVLGEAAVLMVLESGEAMRARHAQAWARLAGCGWSADAFHITQPCPDASGSVRAMRHALQEAGLAPSAIGFCSAHGTGTLANDSAETQAFQTVFEGTPPPVTAFKSMLGHSLGAAAATEAAAAILSLQHQFVPPTLNLEHQDPACVIDCVTGSGRKVQTECCLTNSLGFGGTNASLVFCRAGEAQR